jgi:hypothetical protein
MNHNRDNSTKPIPGWRKPMNKLKARTKDGKTVLLSVSQNPPAHGRLPLRWNSPKAVKAKALDMGLTLIGKRQ